MTKTKAFDFQQSAMFNDLKFFFNRGGFLFSSLVFHFNQCWSDSKMNFFKTTMSAGQISQLHALLPDRVRSKRRPVIRVADWMNI